MLVTVARLVELGMSIPNIVSEGTIPMDRVDAAITAYPEDRGNPGRIVEAAKFCRFITGKLEAEQLRILRLRSSLEFLCQMVKQTSSSDRKRLDTSIVEFRLLSETAASADELRTKYLSVLDSIETAVFMAEVARYTQELAVPVSTGDPINDLPTAEQRIAAILTPPPAKARRKPRNYVPKKDKMRNSGELEPKMKEGRAPKGGKKMKAER